jgi:DNA-binding protein H-NS
MKKPRKIVSNHPNIIRQFNALEIDAQAKLLLELANHFDLSLLQRQSYLKDELLKVIDAEKRSTSVKAFAKAALPAAKRERAKARPQYQSRKDKKLFWAGRGSHPRWLREEMKASGKKLDWFKIK